MKFSGLCRLVSPCGVVRGSNEPGILRPLRHGVKPSLIQNGVLKRTLQPIRESRKISPRVDAGYLPLFFAGAENGFNH
jgi:hypothetical protein